jgi:hypothetical protein
MLIDNKLTIPKKKKKKKTVTTNETCSPLIAGLCFSAWPLYSPYIITKTEGFLLLATIFSLCGIRVGPVGYPWSVFAT